MCALVAVAGLQGCGGNPVVGILLPRTGEASSYGESLESGMRVALAEAREHGDLPQKFEVVWADSGSDPDRAVAELKNMVNQRGAKLILGPATSDEAFAVLPELSKLDIVCLSPSASAPGLTKQSKLFFRIYPSDELEGNRAGQFLNNTLKVKTVIVFIGSSRYSAGIEPEFEHQYVESLGGKIAAKIALDKAGWQDRAARALARERPAGVYVIGFAEDIVEALRLLRKEGYAGRVVTTSAFYSGSAIQTAGEIAEGVFFPLPAFDRTSEDPAIQRFVSRYMDTYQRAPDVFAAHGYDAMRLAITVMTIAKPPQTDEIKKALHFGVSEFEGVTGPILFDDYGDVKHYPKMFIVHDGQVISYERYLKQERAKILQQVQDLLRKKQ